LNSATGQGAGLAPFAFHRFARLQAKEAGFSTSRGRNGEGGGMAQSEWSAARPGGHDDTTRSVTSLARFREHAHSQREIRLAAQGRGRRDALRSTHCASLAPVAALALVRLKIPPALCRRLAPACIL